jgi:hypothetical protein
MQLYKPAVLSFKALGITNFCFAASSSLICLSKPPALERAWIERAIGSSEISSLNSITSLPDFLVDEDTYFPEIDFLAGVF